MKSKWLLIVLVALVVGFVGVLVLSCLHGIEDKTKRSDDDTFDDDAADDDAADDDVADDDAADDDVADDDVADDDAADDDSIF